MNYRKLITRSVLSVASALSLLTGCFASTSSSDTGSDGGVTQASSSSASASTAHSSGSSSSSAAPSSGPQPGGLGPYTTSGNKILDKNGNEHFFRGLDRPSLESSCSGNISLNEYQDVMAAWGANVVRLPLNQDCWINSSSNPSYSSSYASTVDDQVQAALGANPPMDIILDLHWSDTGSFSLGANCLTSNISCAQVMADSNSVTFWQQVAAKYKDSPNVIFELYNEPHIGGYMPAATDWGTWLNGGTSGVGFTAVGMQTLYNTIRSAGANNLVVVGGLNWAFDLSMVPSYPVQGTNIVYNTHPYASKTPASDTPAQTLAAWESSFGFLTMTYPVIATEFGDNSMGQTATGSSTDCNPSFDTALIQFMGQQATTMPPHKMSWTAWAFDPGVALSDECSFPDLIYDSQYDPNAVGTVVINALAAGP
jgi:endoglucanase